MDVEKKDDIIFSSINTVMLAEWMKKLKNRLIQKHKLERRIALQWKDGRKPQCLGFYYPAHEYE